MTEKDFDATIRDRLHRIEGQVRGIEKMLDLDQTLEKILVQIQAIISSLESLKAEMLKNEMRKKIIDQIDKTIDLTKM